MIKKVSLLFIFLPVFLLSGCLETRILDDITMVQIAGFDLGENEGTMEQTVAFPTYFEMGEEGELEVIVMGTEGQSPKEIREDLNTEWQRPLRYGQMRILVFGHLFAEQHGISDIVNSFYRDPRVGNQLHVAVMEGRAHDGIDTDLTGARERVGMYYANLINQAEEEEKIPATNLHSFIFDIHSDGRDAYLPFFTIHEETLKLNGLALFDGEYKVGHLGPMSPLSLKS
ncbi:hypothetical protein [Thalassobacillus sp. C254]|uniref:Ger(x)C family spore germination protein n=1 Tax=Thalassobacillus sp. C254 TaxID=1225341 RepID=UPI0006D08E62|nr:hypothetical protein [Thalassobacillus sp. C254]